MSCGVEQVCVVSGGAEWEEFNDKRLDNVLNEMDGIACVVLRNLQHIMIDLRRRTWDVYDLSSVMDETSPAELDFLTAKQVVGRHQSNREKHAAYNLMNRRKYKYKATNQILSIHYHSNYHLNDGHSHFITKRSCCNFSVS